MSNKYFFIYYFDYFNSASHNKQSAYSLAVTITITDSNTDSLHIDSEAESCQKNLTVSQQYMAVETFIFATVLREL